MAIRVAHVIDLAVAAAIYDAARAVAADDFGWWTDVRRRNRPSSSGAALCAADRRQRRAATDGAARSVDWRRTAVYRTAEGLDRTRATAAPSSAGAVGPGHGRAISRADRDAAIIRIVDRVWDRDDRAASGRA